MSTDHAAVSSVTETACVVVDCNEWIRLKWLGSPIGLTFLSILSRDQSLKLAIPEVLEGELNKHRAETARKLLRRLEEIHEEIGTVTGNTLSAGIITLREADIDVAVQRRLAVVANRTIYPEMTIAEVRQALARVNQEAPPNGPKNQQMKDSLLWEACVTLSKGSKVFFISGDNGFYAGRQSNNGLAENLASEPAVESGQLQVFPTLEDALTTFAPDSLADPREIQAIDVEDLLAKEALQAFGLSSIAADLQATITLRGVVPQYFRTDSTVVFAVSFTAFFDINKDVDARVRGEAAVSGDCTLDGRTATLGTVNHESINWRLNDVSGGDMRWRPEVLPSRS